MTFTIKLLFLILCSVSVFSQPLIITTYDSIQTPNQWYDYKTPTYLYLQFTLSIYNNSAVTQDYTVLFSSGLNSGSISNFNRQALNTYLENITYRLTSVASNSDSFLLKDFSDLDLTESNSLTNQASSDQIPPYNDTDLSFFLSIDPNQTIRSGSYTDQINIKVYNKKPLDITSETDSLNETISIPVTIDVLKYSSLDFEQDDLTINLLFMGQAQIETIYSTINSNTGFSISASSANDGNLIHNDITEATAIPYHIRLKTNESDFTSWTEPSLSDSTLFTNQLIPTAYHSAEFQIKISPYASHDSFLEGSYSDTLTLTISEY